MPKATRKEARSAEGGQRQVNVRLDLRLYQTLESVARQERRTVPQVVRHLIEDVLLQRVGVGQVVEDIPAWEVTRLATAGRGFDWLEYEPDLYDDRFGEPL